MIELDRKMKFRIQFAFWDKFKTVKNMQIKQVSNLARLAAELVSTQSLNFDLIKDLDFQQLEGNTLTFLTVYFTAILKEYGLSFILAHAYAL